MSDEKVQSDYIFDTASDEEAAKFRLSPHLINLMSEEPFFSSLIRQIRREKTDKIPTAGVTCIDGSLALYWNPKFLASLSADEIKGLIKHECYHLIFKHCTARKQTPHQMWNMATDLAINSLISERLLPEGGLIPGEGKFEGLPKGESAEWYLANMPDFEEEDQGQKGDGADQEGVGEGLSPAPAPDQRGDDLRTRRLPEGDARCEHRGPSAEETAIRHDKKEQIRGLLE